MITPDLWNTLDLGRPQLAIALFYRFDFRVRLLYRLPPCQNQNGWDAFALILREAPDRILQIEIVDDDRIKHFAPLPDLQPAPFLTDLCISFTYHVESSCPPLSAIYNMEAPRLQTLQLTLADSRAAWTSKIVRSTSLRTIWIASGAFTRPAALVDVMEALKHLPYLETLDWQTVEFSSVLDVSRSGRLHMARLRHITLSGMHAAPIISLLQCVSFHVDARVVVRCDRESGLTQFAPLWDAVTTHCGRNANPGWNHLSISEESQKGTWLNVDYSHTTNLLCGVSLPMMSSVRIEWRSDSGGLFADELAGILASRLAILPITVLQLRIRNFSGDSARSLWHSLLTCCMQVQVLKLLDVATISWFFKTLDQTMVTSAESDLVLLAPSLKAIICYGLDHGKRPAMADDWLKACVRVVSARNRLARRDGSRISAIERVRSRRYDLRLGYEVEEHLEPLKAILPPESLSRPPAMADYH
jgi:hypothetical protein